MGWINLFQRRQTPDRFARMMMERIKAAGDPRPVTYDAGSFSLTSADRGAVTNLHNLYAEYQRADREDREKVVRNFLAAWFTTEMDLPEALDDARPDLLLSLRSRSYYEVGVALMSDRLEPNEQLLYAEVGGSLAVSPIYDLPTSIRSLTHDDLRAWGVTLYEALEIATQNLREATSEVAQAGDLFLFASGDSHDAARLMLTDVIGELGVEGAPVAMAPNREMLLVTGDASEEGLRQMASIAAEGIDHERSISGVTFRLEHDDWAPWLPGPSHPAYAELLLLRVKTAGGDYAQQKVLLDKRHARDGADVYVAPFNAIRGQSEGDITTHAVWLQDHPTLLPRTDQLVLMTQEADGSPGGVAAAASWRRVEEVAGELLERVDCYPERWRTLAFPSAKQIAEIGTASWARSGPPPDA